MTTEITVAPEDRVLWRAELRELLHVSSETMRRWLKDKKLPPADVQISRRTMGWKVSTLKNAGIDLM